MPIKHDVFKYKIFYTLVRGLLITGDIFTLLFQYPCSVNEHAYGH